MLAASQGAISMVVRLELDGLMVQKPVSGPELGATRAFTGTYFRASLDAMLFTDNAQLGPQLAVETSKTAVLDAEQVTSIANAVGMSR
jgi:hypothetical protein